MNNNQGQKDNNQVKGNSVLLTIIAVSTLLVAVIGATFAYFTASISGNNTASSVIVNASNIASITYNNTNVLTLDNAYPGQYSNEITFTVATTKATDVAIPYRIVWASVSNNFANKGDLVYRITGAKSTSSDAANSGGWTTAPSTIVAGGEPITILDNTFPVSNTVTTHTYQMQMHFKETGTNQNSNQGKSFTGKVEVKLNDGDNYSDTKYYTSSAPQGTTTEPTSAY